MRASADSRGVRAAGWLAGAAGLALALGVAAWALRPAELTLPEGGPQAAQPLPSGQSVTLIEALWDDQGGGAVWLRLRYVAPQIGPGPDQLDAAAAVGDMRALCLRDGLPMLKNAKHEVAQIIISLSAEAVPFGASAPDVTQYFDAFRPERDDCIWEEF